MEVVEKFEEDKKVPYVGGIGDVDDFIEKLKAHPNPSKFLKSKVVPREYATARSVCVKEAVQPAEHGCRCHCCNKPLTGHVKGGHPHKYTLKEQPRFHFIGKYVFAKRQDFHANCNLDESDESSVVTSICVVQSQVDKDKDEKSGFNLLHLLRLD